MQWRHARLHSLVICQATYRGAPRSDVSLSSMLFDDQSLFLQLGEKRLRLLRHLARRVLELLIELGGELAGLRARNDLAHDRRAGGAQRVHLLGARLEQHRAELLFPELDEWSKLHDSLSMGDEAGVGV